MNALTADEKAIWIAVYAGECVWSRRASETTNLKAAYRAAENAVVGFREQELGARAEAQASLDAALAADATNAGLRTPKAEKQREANRR